MTTRLFGCLFLPSTGKTSIVLIKVLTKLFKDQILCVHGNNVVIKENDMYRAVKSRKGIAKDHEDIRMEKINGVNLKEGYSKKLEIVTPMEVSYE